MELVVELAAILLTLALAVVKSFNYAPHDGSDFELSRKAHAGDAQAAVEVQRRQVLPALVSLQYIKEIIISVAIAAIMLGTHSSVVGALLSALYFFVAYLIAVRGWLDRPVRWLQRAIEPVLVKWASVLAPVLKFMSVKQQPQANVRVGSRDELEYLIQSDTKILQPNEKLQVLAALHFSHATIGDIMVPRDKIATVGASETVGPLLLDRLHKVGHHIFVAIGKDADDIKGLLHMTDATSGHPAIKKVKDAMRPLVHYVRQGDSLGSLLGASLQSGRQLFIVVDNNGNTMGLVTLYDALTALLGSAPPDPQHLSTDPKKEN